MNETIIEIQELSKRFAKEQECALKGISAGIPKGKITGLVGPDGAGKTTLMRILAGLLTITSGDVTILGRDLRKDAEVVSYFTGYMPQKFGLYDDLTVDQNLSLYADLRDVVGKEREETFERLLSFTDLKRFKKRLARNLSGGMKQKLGLACALIKKPQLLLLDEPSVGVDPLSRRELWQMVKNLAGEGISVVWSTAYLDEAEQCDNVLLLNEGELLYQGYPIHLTERLKDRVYMVTSKETDKRETLLKLLRKDGVIDGVIQGNKIRVVVNGSGTKIEGEKVPPRFEDAFIDILGGGPKGESELAENAPQVDGNENHPIVAENIVKRFNSFTAVDSVSIDVRPGEVFGLLGPNGAGKTTIFKMLCGLLRPTEGETFVNGLNLQKAPDLARMNIGYMAQKFSLYGNLSVKQNLEFFAGIYNLQNSKKKEAIKEMVKIFGLENYLSTSAEELPLGYKQRLSLACANMHSPSILFLDEPTSGVDPITRREFWNHINGLVRKGVTIMITTHFMEEAEYCDRIAFIYKGKIIKTASPEEIKKNVQTKELLNPTLEDAFIEMIQNYDREVVHEGS